MVSFNRAKDAEMSQNVTIDKTLLEEMADFRKRL